LINLDSLLALLAIPKENASLFSLRHSKKAKRLIFKHSIRNGFEIVLPLFYDDNWVLETVTTNKPKIENRLIEIKEARTELKPTTIRLPLLGISWKVIYRETNEKDLNAITETQTTLEVSEKTEDTFWTSTVLQQWLHAKALVYLPKHLDDVSAKLKLPYNNVRIKRQKTLWGSCSSKGNINLNRNLMLMPSEVVDYVLHHEIVHLKVLSHSSKFWKELERSFPDYKKSIKQLKYFVGNKIPEWALV
jgi:predicted metal-dependent hydrolase